MLWNKDTGATRPAPRWLRLFLIALLAAGLSAAGEGQRHYELGREAESRGAVDEAYLHYSRARAHEPANRRYIAAAQRVRPLGQPVLAAMAAAADAGDAADLPLEPPPPAPIPEGPPPPDLRGPVRLEPENVRHDLRIDSTAQEAWERLADLFGLRVIFDDGYRTDREVRFELDHVDFPRAAYALGEATKSFVVPVSNRLFLVAEDTQQKRAELEPVAVATFHLNNAPTPEAMQELLQGVQQTLDVQRLQRSGDLIYIRDTVRKVRMAREMYRYLSVAPAEVVLEIELLAVNRDRTTDLGLSLPTSFPVTNFSTVLNATPPEAGEDISRMIGIGGGDSQLGVTVGSSSLVARLQAGDAQTIQRFQIRATHGLPADLRIGERYPIINASFSTGVPPDGDEGQFRQPVPSFTFEDLGLTCAVTPSVHSGREVTLQLELTFRLLAGGVVNGVPVLSNREMSSQVRLEEGDVALVSGIAVREERVSGSGLWPLAQLPWIGRFFRQPNVQVNHRDLILTLRPRIVRLPPGEVASPPDLRFGPEQRPLPAL